MYSKKICLDHYYYCTSTVSNCDYKHYDMHYACNYIPKMIIAERISARL